MERVLFIFRRDLRLEDNIGLNAALKQAKEVILSFIFTPDQIERNAYQSRHCLQFMIESLEELEKECAAQGGKLYLFYGQPEQIVEACIATLKVDGVVVNADYTPYSLERDQQLAKVCGQKGISFHSFDDAVLHPLQETLKGDGTPYTVFTPFYKNALKLEVQPSVRQAQGRFYTKPISFAKDDSLYQQVLPIRSAQQRGGRSEALKILKDLSRFSNYGNVRDFPALDATTHLSPHLKFTTCSVREAYEAIAKQQGKESELIRSLYWRDFFTSIGFFFPYVFKGAFKQQYDRLVWGNDKKLFKRWCEGNTGFPLVDAGMREMNQTGFMHNRVRMIAASLLVKDLHIDWRWGEKYFAQTLIDYDPMVNNGNWQWVASTGCDAQPYFRIFNPWTQGSKFDPDCLYIKRWVPELSDLSPKAIHGWHLEKNRPRGHPYPSPLVDHSLEAKVTLESYRKI